MIRRPQLDEPRGEAGTSRISAWQFVGSYPHVANDSKYEITIVSKGETFFAICECVQCADQFGAGDDTPSREAAFEAALKAIEEHRHAED